MLCTSTNYRLLNGFDDPEITPDVWNNLVKKGSSNVIFMTWQWQKSWWEIFGRGQLLLILVEEEGEPIVIAPLFADCGMIYFVGSGGSDYLDFIGKIYNAEMLEELLQFSKSHVTQFVGFYFYHILDNSETHNKLRESTILNKWELHNEGSMPAPFLNMKAFPEHVQLATRKKSLIRHENWFRKNGELQVKHLTLKEEILPHLDDFFKQHIQRWNSTPFPSLFLDPKQQLFYQKITNTIGTCGWLRFTIIRWNKIPISYHFGFNFSDFFLWYKPTFDISLSRNSPGEVLIRQLLIRAIEEGTQIFDFGLGDELFKKRFATDVQTVKNCSLYPK